MITRKRKVGSSGRDPSTKSSHPTDNLSLTKEMRRSRQIKAKKVMSEEWKTDEPKQSPAKSKSGRLIRNNKKLVPTTSPSSKAVTKGQKTPELRKVNKPAKNKISPSKTVIKKQVKEKQGSEQLIPKSRRVNNLAKNPEITPSKKAPSKKQANETQNLEQPKLRKVNKPAKKVMTSPSPKQVTKEQEKEIQQLEQQAPELRKLTKPAKKLSLTPLKQSKRISKLNAEQNNSKNVDIYEFTYDPKEEPPPKKKKRTVRKKPKPAQVKTYNYNNNYDKNVSKALSALKNVIATKTKKTVRQNKNEKAPMTKTNKLPNIQEVAMVTSTPRPQACEPVNNNIQKVNKNHTQTNTSDKQISVSTPANYNSIRIEDMAADFEMSDNHDDFNYSPVYSPEHMPSPNPRVSMTNENLPPAVINSKDPLNLQGDLSFFDDHPVANSSMIKSIRNVAPSPRHPLASPWRVEFGSLPIKWQINTFIKPNMTPAVESSFITENSKRHVYTNLLPAANDATNDGPQIFEKNTSSLKQPSIISFIKEMAEKSAKKRGRSISPIKANSLFEESIQSRTNINTTINNAVTPKKTAAKTLSTPNKDVLSPLRTITNLNKENSNRKKENKLAKSPKKQNKDRSYFGFDVTDEMDQENVSPVKVIESRRVKALRPRSRAVLQEINGVTGPSRAALPTKSKIIASSDAVNKMYEDLKSAEDAPVFPQTETPKDPAITVLEADDCDDDESVHLFEDMDVIHHLKPHRKSYGKPKKVMFSQTTVTGVNQNIDEAHSESDIDDFGDLNFSTALMKEKKVKKKKVRNLRSKKEEKEANEWAAAFNSMCEDIDQFPLVVE